MSGGGISLKVAEVADNVLLNAETGGMEGLNGLLSVSTHLPIPSCPGGTIQE